MSESVVPLGPQSPHPAPLRGVDPLPQGERGRITRFAGYAAVFDRVDGGGDVIRKGAFAESLARRREIPLLWQHKAGVVIGRVERVEEDSRGLRVIGELGGDADAARAAGLLGSGAVTGLSFGYRVGDASQANGVRELRELELVEVSLVAKPMQRLARVHAVER